MAQQIRLRPWQKAALDAFAGRPGPDFLAVATPGAGKTTFALDGRAPATSPRTRAGAWSSSPRPSTSRSSGRDAAAALDLHLDPEWIAGRRRACRPTCTAWSPPTSRSPCSAGAAARRSRASAFVVLDEIHHAGDERAWGDAIRARLRRRGAPPGPVGHAVPLATPARSRSSATTTTRLAQPDFEYGYGDALADGGVVRPVYFPRIERPDGVDRRPTAATHAAHLRRPRSTAARASQRLRTALSLEGEWLPAVLAQAHEQLTRHPRARSPTPAAWSSPSTRTTPAASRLLRRRASASTPTRRRPPTTPAPRRASPPSPQRRDPWIVAVRMVSEGVDIPRLRVGVFATTTTTELFFRQAVGRLVRWTRGVRRQQAFLFIPDDPRLRAPRPRIAEQRRHSLRRDADARAPSPTRSRPSRSRRRAADDQLSLFAAISAVAAGTAPDHGAAARRRR